MHIIHDVLNNLIRFKPKFQIIIKCKNIFHQTLHPII